METAKERIALAPESCKGVLTKAYAGSASPRSAIKAFCLQCVGYERVEVTNCTAFACPLHKYRPFRGVQSVLE